MRCCSLPFRVLTSAQATDTLPPDAKLKDVGPATLADSGRLGGD
jgi:hypothetical protein